MRPQRNRTRVTPLSKVSEIIHASITGDRKQNPIIDKLNEILATKYGLQIYKIFSVTISSSPIKRELKIEKSTSEVAQDVSDVLENFGIFGYHVESITIALPVSPNPVHCEPYLIFTDHGVEFGWTCSNT